MLRVRATRLALGPNVLTTAVRRSLTTATLSFGRASIPGGIWLKKLVARAGHMAGFLKGFLRVQEMVANSCSGHTEMT